jgi:putative nucleotidyltransferase with HDIG domain
MKTKDSALPYADLLERIKVALPENTSVHLVGGAVRDFLLNRTTHDLDFVLPKDAIAISRKVANTLGAPFYPIDPERDTGRILVTDPTGVRLVLDFAAYRGPDLESDLRGRDFTINAIAVDLRRSHSLFDPLGGINDLREGVLRTCSEAAFLSDPIRILRVVRQAVEFGFRILPETRRLIQPAIPGLSRASPERLRDELFRILEGSKSTSALRILDVLGVLQSILPELTALQELTQSPPHTSDVWEHTLSTTQELANIMDVLAPEYNPEAGTNLTMGLIALRLGRYRQPLYEHLSKPLNPERSLHSLLLFAALYHDVGKPACRQVLEDGSIHFLEHERLGAQLVAKRCEELHLSKVEIDRIQLVVRNHMRPVFLAHDGAQPSRRAIYRFYRDCGEAGVDICLLSLADILATYGPSLVQEVWTHHLDVIRVLLESFWEQKQEKVSPPILLNGDEIMRVFNLKPGPQIGRLLEAIRETQAAGELHDYQEALIFARAWLEKN